MKIIKEKIKKLQDYFFDHPGLRTAIEYFVTFFGAALSAFIYAYCYKAFISPNATEIVNGITVKKPVLITGGASGSAQIILKIFELFGLQDYDFGNTSLYYIIQSACYVLINLPLAYLSFKKIGKKFTLFTLINVGLYFVFVNIIPQNMCTFYYLEGSHIVLDQFARALFAGILTGLSIALAVQFDHSSGGTDIISVYVTSKKTNISMGKVSMGLNVIIVSIYTLLTCLQEGNASFITMTLYSFVYFFASSTVIDAIVSRNKKEQLQIVTSNNKLPDILISYFPHSATIVHGEGAFTKKDRLVVYIVMSTYEVKKAIKIIQELDPMAFITITKVSSQVGRFYITPRK